MGKTEGFSGAFNEEIFKLFLLRWPLAVFLLFLFFYLLLKLLMLHRMNRAPSVRVVVIVSKVEEVGAELRDVEFDFLRVASIHVLEFIEDFFFFIATVKSQYDPKHVLFLRMRLLRVIFLHKGFDLLELFLPFILIKDFLDKHLDGLFVLVPLLHVLLLILEHLWRKHQVSSIHLWRVPFFVWSMLVRRSVRMQSVTSPSVQLIAWDLLAMKFLKIKVVHSGFLISD